MTTGTTILTLAKTGTPDEVALAQTIARALWTMRDTLDRWILCGTDGRTDEYQAASELARQHWAAAHAIDTITLDEALDLATRTGAVARTQIQMKRGRWTDDEWTRVATAADVACEAAARAAA